MKLLQRLGTVSAILWCLAGASYAAPRVAIVTPLGGDVWIGDSKLTSPRIVEEGQKLLLGSNGKARVQLLGSAKERVLDGSNTTIVIRKADLEKDGKVLSRGSIAVADEIGNISKSASAGSRRSSTRMNYVVGFSFCLPPYPTDGGWKADVVSPAESFPKGGVQVTLTDLTVEGSEPQSMPISDPIPDLTFPREMLIPGHRYDLEIKGPRSRYYRQFQIMTPAEKSELMATAAAIHKEALDSGELALLVRLANFYLSFDENEKVVDVLTEVVNKPSFKDLDPGLKDNVKEALDLTLRSLDRKNYEEPHAQ